MSKWTAFCLQEGRVKLIFWPVLRWEKIVTPRCKGIGPTPSEKIQKAVHLPFNTFVCNDFRVDRFFTLAVQQKN